MIQGIDLKKTYDGQLIFHESSFDIRSGEIVGFYGDSGCGKSTLAKILCGVVRADGGQIRMDEQVLWDPTQKYDRKLGIKILRCYILPNVAQPFITMVGMSVSVCVGGSVLIENIFSIDGMGKLLTEAVYTLDYPLMQGILFVTTGIMALSILVTDLLRAAIDPRVRRRQADAEEA